MKFIPWTCLVGVLLIVACQEETKSVEQEVTLLDEPAYYQLELRGHALATKESFSRSACMIVTPQVEAPSAENFENGENPLDVGLVSGRPSEVSDLGALWFFTNTNLCGLLDNVCAVGSAASGLDVAYVDLDETQRSVTAEIDPLVFDNKGAVEVLTFRKNLCILCRHE